MKIFQKLLLSEIIFPLSVALYLVVRGIILYRSPASWFGFFTLTGGILLVFVAAPLIFYLLWKKLREMTKDSLGKKTLCILNVLGLLAILIIFKNYLLWSPTREVFESCYTTDGHDADESKCFQEMFGPSRPFRLQSHKLEIRWLKGTCHTVEEAYSSPVMGKIIVSPQEGVFCRIGSLCFTRDRNVNCPIDVLDTQLVPVP